jgi:hypothetical protein
VTDLIKVVVAKTVAERPLAVKVQRKLQRLGYYAGQYQGVVKTDAPKEEVYRIIEELTERR